MVKVKDLSYLTKAYDEKIQRVKDIDAPLNFIFYTDPHNGLSEWDCKKHTDWADTEFESAIDTVNSMQYIIDRLPNLKCVICGGDLGNDYHTDPKMAHKSIEDMANALYEYIIAECKKEIPDLQTGSFGADMKISLENDGPFTIILDSRDL